MAAGDVTANISEVSGKALLFDGVNDWVQISPAPKLAILKNITISTWIKLTNPITADIRAVNKEQGYALLRDGVTGNDALQLYLWGSGLRGPKITFTNDGWHHIAATTNVSEGTIRAYLDGADVGTITHGFTEIQYSNQSLFLGGLNTATKVLDGIMEDVRIYSRTLTPDEISKIYKQHTPNNINLEAYYSFNNPTDPGHDDSGNGNDGTVVGAVSVGGHNTIEDDIKTARVSANDVWGFIPLANNQIMMAHIEEA